MKEKTRADAREVLMAFLRDNKLRKTPERFAVLDAVYGFKKPFTLQELDGAMQQSAFTVSRATLYNALRLFIRLRLVACLRNSAGTRYEPILGNNNHCRQVCMQCGKTTELKAVRLESAVEEMPLKRFRREGFMLYIYGLCSSCVAKNTRERKKQQDKAQKKAIGGRKTDAESNNRKKETPQRKTK